MGGEGEGEGAHRPSQGFGSMAWLRAESTRAPFLTHLSTSDMSHTPATTSSSSNYQFIFDNALEAYRKRTKEDLRTHPMFAKLETCDSPDAVLAVFRGQIPTLNHSRGMDDTKWLDPTVNALYTFSDVIGGSIGLVRYQVDSSRIQYSS